MWDFREYEIAYDVLGKQLHIKRLMSGVFKLYQVNKLFDWLTLAAKNEVRLRVRVTLSLVHLRLHF